MGNQPFFISIDGQQIEVTKKVYLVYYRSKRRERYYECDIKIERAIYDETGNISGYAPPKEDSLDRLIESGRAFPAEQKSVETTAMGKTRHPVDPRRKKTNADMLRNHGDSAVTPSA